MLILHAGHQKVFSKKICVSDTKCDVTTSNVTILSNMSRKCMSKTIVLKSFQVCKTDSCYEQKCILKS